MENKLGNQKPYRPKWLKRQAKEKAYKTRDGHYASSAPTKLHMPICEPHRCYCRSVAHNAA